MSARSFRREREREQRRARRRHRIRGRKTLAIGLTIGATALWGGPVADAATFSVDNTNDTTGPGDCAPEAAGDCSLRQAIDKANSNTGVDDVVSLAGLSGTITLTNGEIHVGTVGTPSGNIAIQGPGADELTISGDANENGEHDVTVYPASAGGTITPGDSPIFRFSGQFDSDDSLSGVTLSDGVSGAFTTDAGLIRGTHGGAITSTVSNLTIMDTILSDNLASLDGGAIYAAGNLTLVDSEVSGNTAYGTGAGIRSHATAGQLTITDSTISGNQTLGKNYAPLGPAFDYASGAGGGVWSFARHNTITGSTISDNDAQDYNTPAGIETYVTSSGGGLYIDAGTYQSDIDITASTISGNTAVSAGGGAWLKAENSSVEGSTISGNGFGETHDPAYGGGLFTRHPAKIEDSTLSDNGHSAGDDPVYGGGLFATGATEVSGTTIDGNTAGGSTGGAAGGLGWSSYDGEALTLSSSTISGNSAPAGAGGGIGLFTQNIYDTSGLRLDHSGPVVLRNSTIASNGAGAAAGVYEQAYSGQTPNTEARKTGGVKLSSTIVGGNKAGDLGMNGPTTGFNVGHSLIQSCSDDFFLTPAPAGSNVFGLDPALGALGDNGGPTATQLPSAVSPAVDAGVSNGEPSDQRGAAFPRVVDTPAANRVGGDGTDIGSVERSDGTGSSAAGAPSCGVLPPVPPVTGGGSAPAATPAPASSAPRKKKKRCKKKKKKQGDQGRAAKAKKCKKKRKSGAAAAGTTPRGRPRLGVMRSPGRR